MSLTTFAFTHNDGGSVSVRTAGTHDKPLFCVKDVCAALGVKNYHNKAAILEDEDKGLQVVETPGGSQEMMFCTEAGLYDIVMSCRGARRKGTAAYRFRRWVIAEVLPSIRMTGGYGEAAVRVADQHNTTTAQSASLAVRKQELDLRMIAMAQAYTDDARMQALAQEKLASLLNGGNSTQVALPKTVSELMEESGLFTPALLLQKRSSIGRGVANLYREHHGEPPVTRKIVNGHFCNVKIYPAEHHQQILQWITHITRIPGNRTARALM